MNGALAGVWIALAAGFLERGAGPLDYGLAVQNGIIAWCFLIRRTPVRTAGLAGLLLAGATTMLPLLALSSAAHSALEPVALALELCSLAWICWGLLSLGRSFGVSPADRGVVTHGPYRLVRHPIYAGEIAFTLAYTLGSPSWQNALVLALLASCQVVRALWEEEVLSHNTAYREYRARVPWRLLPGVF